MQLSSSLAHTSEAIAMVIATLTPLISGVHKLPRLGRFCGTSAHSFQLKNSHHKTSEVSAENRHQS